jgi:hypothetical protein
MLYKYTKTDGTYVGTEFEPTYIYLHRNGCYNICTEEKAQGVAIRNTPYNLEGREPMEGLETVRFEMIWQEEYERIIAEEQRELLDIISGEVVGDENSDES